MNRVEEHYLKYKELTASMKVAHRLDLDGTRSLINRMNSARLLLGKYFFTTEIDYFKYKDESVGTVFREIGKSSSYRYFDQLMKVANLVEDLETHYKVEKFWQEDSPSILINKKSEMTLEELYYFLDLEISRMDMLVDFLEDLTSGIII